MTLQKNKEGKTLWFALWIVFIYNHNESNLRLAIAELLASHTPNIQWADFIRLRTKRHLGPIAAIFTSLHS